MNVAEEGAAILAEIKAMSRENSGETDIYYMAVQSAFIRRAFTGKGELIGPAWMRAIYATCSRPATFARARPHVLSLYGGDRPADLTDEDIREAGMWNPEYRNRSRLPDQRALVHREYYLDRGRGDGYAVGVRATHFDVHRALAGERYDQRLDRIKAESLGIAPMSETREEQTTGYIGADCAWCRENKR
jgi:hypothetical protein